jgi:hypothetical protein
LLLSTLRDLLTVSRLAKPEVRVHSLNILRALFRDSRLGEAVEPFVADGVKVAIEGFKAAAWAVSMTRHFGLRVVSTWIQSYDRELQPQRKRCRNLQRRKYPSAFWKQKYFLLPKNDLAYYNAGVVVENFEVVGMAPDNGS